MKITRITFEPEEGGTWWCRLSWKSRQSVDTLSVYELSCGGFHTRPGAFFSVWWKARSLDFLTSQALPIRSPWRKRWDRFWYRGGWGGLYLGLPMGFLYPPYKLSLGIVLGRVCGSMVGLIICFSLFCLFETLMDRKIRKEEQGSEIDEFNLHNR